LSKSASGAGARAAPPRVFVVSAPSGTGKTTLNRRLIAEHDSVMMSVSYTTRQPRGGEVDGVDYRFVSNEAFRQLIAQGQMLEYAEVFGTLYGTSLAEVERIHAGGRVALLEIDVQGWRQAREKLAGAQAIFILPPSVEALWKRLENRGTEAKDVRWRRLMTARSEISCGSLYGAFIINHTLDTAYTDLEDIVIKGKNPKIGAAEGDALCRRLLHEFDNSPWLQKLSRELADK
jgi:guanylate kinase